MSCPFCDTSNLALCGETENLLAFRDKFPVSPGHTLVVPKRHVASFFEMSQNEKNEVFQLIEVLKAELDEEFGPDGYNVGWNDGASAGQTVFHFHLHIIPRFDGDVEDARGGVRWVIPTKAKYWKD